MENVTYYFSSFVMFRKAFLDFLSFYIHYILYTHCDVEWDKQP